MPRYIEVKQSAVKGLVKWLLYGEPYNRDLPLTIEAFASNGGRNTGEVGRAKRDKRIAWLKEKAQCDILGCAVCEYLWPGYQITETIYHSGPPMVRTTKPLCGDCFSRRAFSCGECGGAFSARDFTLTLTRENGQVCAACRATHYRSCNRCGRYDREASLHTSGACRGCMSLPASRPDRSQRSEVILQYSARAENTEKPWLQLPGELTDRDKPSPRAAASYRTYRAQDVPTETFYESQPNEHPESYYRRLMDDFDRGRNGRGRRGGDGSYVTLARTAYEAWLEENADVRVYNPKAAPTMWLGFELEAVCKSNTSNFEAAPAITEAFDGRGICKSDGSIRGDGFEMVSMPGTLAYHQTQWRGWLKTVQHHMEGWNQPSCGMHVHLSRRALTGLQIARVGVFLNTQANEAFVTKVAGRSPGEYSRRLVKGFHSFRGEEGERGRMKSVVDSWKANSQARTVKSGQYFLHGTKYELLNVKNPHTVELRIFQSNVASVGFLKNIDFTHAVFSWAAQASNRELYSNFFLAWLDQNRGVYPNLTLWAVRENLLTKRHNEAEERQLCA